MLVPQRPTRPEPPQDRVIEELIEERDAILERLGRVLDERDDALHRLEQYGETP